jgi:hypothetical protein
MFEVFEWFVVNSKKCLNFIDHPRLGEYHTEASKVGLASGTRKQGTDARFLFCTSLSSSWEACSHRHVVFEPEGFQKVSVRTIRNYCISVFIL